MNSLTVQPSGLPAMSHEEIDKVRSLETRLKELPQLELETRHTIHAGLYSRTITLPAGAALTGALLKVPTTLIISGHVTVYIGERTVELQGYHVLPASSGRKQAFIAHSDTELTMLCRTEARTVADIEREITDEYGMLCSNNADATNITVITEDAICPVPQLLH